MITEQQVIDTLSTIFDPELPVNIWDLGLIYQIDIHYDNVIYLTMTLTDPNCPVAESLPIEVKEKVAAIPGVEQVFLKITFDPPWGLERISDAVKLDLGLL
jgi:FeS assembly SUF system protein